LIEVIRVYIPNKNKCIHFVSFHSFPLYFELEAVIVGMVTGCDVPLPCWRVPTFLYAFFSFVESLWCRSLFLRGIATEVRFSLPY
jgi:hypothetical protein